MRLDLSSLIDGMMVYWWLMEVRSVLISDGGGSEEVKGW